MALTGKLTYKGLDVDEAYLKVMEVTHRAVDTQAEDGSWNKANHADYSARVYKDATAYGANPDQAIYTIAGTFTPSVANTANLNIVKQTYLHLKTLADYDELTDC
tara:strand:+ start:384 stop:698 length:315 start_codon:yes stop_codon:yes gene_type:complete